MKKLMWTLTVGMALAFGMGLHAAGVTWAWQGSFAANAPTNAYLWAQDGNWDRAGYPNSTDDTANIYTATASGTFKYIRYPEGLKIARINAGKDKTVFLGDALTCSAASPKDYSSNDALYIFADTITAPQGFGGGDAILAADLNLTDAAGTTTFSAARFTHRLDLYATSSEPGCTNAILNWKKATQGSGSGRFYARRGAAAVTAGYAQTAGSPFFRRVDAAGHDLAVGTVVTGEGIPANTFLRRNFTDGWIELSQAATTTVASNALAFAAFTPNVYQHLVQYYANAAANAPVVLSKYRAEDTAVLEIDTFQLDGVSAGFSCDANTCPWHVILHKVGKSSGRMRLCNCDIEFAARTDGGTPGIPEAVVQMENAAHEAKLTVGAGLTASIMTLSNVVGTVTKKGAGTLAVTLANDTAANTGTIVVEEGVFEIRGTTDGADSWVKKIVLKAGATLKLDVTVKTDGLEAEAGAILQGPGSLDYSGCAPSSLPAGLIMRDGATMVVRATGGALVKARPTSVTTADLGDPAFWVNTDNPDADMDYTVSGTTTNVTRWCDCRGRDAKYNFATNRNLAAEYRIF